MRAAEESTIDLYSMPDHPAAAVLANRRHRLNRTLETVERMPRTGSSHFKALVILVTANFALGHKRILLIEVS